METDGELAPVWKALADPTRRRILDRLRHEPMTTGGLVAGFDMTRFGIMKHLKILEAAGLVVTRKRGRERWNHLNAVPLRQIYERWVDRYADVWSTSLTELKELTERGGTAMKTFELAQEIRIAAPRDKVWKALTTEVNQWWAFRIGERGSAIGLDARLGGSFTERWGDNEGALWGTVTYFHVGHKLRLEGGLGMSGPGHNKWIYELEDDGAGTLLKLTHFLMGHREQDVETRYTRGWAYLLETCLPAWAVDGKTYDQLPPHEE